jgi:hypothetical protein
MSFHILALYLCVFTFGVSHGSNPGRRVPDVVQYDGSLLNGLQTVPRWQQDFNRPMGHTLGLIGASFYLRKPTPPSTWRRI